MLSFATLLDIFSAPQRSHKFTSSHYFSLQSSADLGLQSQLGKTGTARPPRRRMPVSVIALPKREEVADYVLGLQILRRSIQDLIIPVKTENNSLV